MAKSQEIRPGPSLARRATVPADSQNHAKPFSHGSHIRTLGGGLLSPRQSGGDIDLEAGQQHRCRARSAWKLAVFDVTAGFEA